MNLNGSDAGDTKSNLDGPLRCPRCGKLLVHHNQGRLLPRWFTVGSAAVALIHVSDPTLLPSLLNLLGRLLTRNDG